MASVPLVPSRVAPRATNRWASSNERMPPEAFTCTAWLHVGPHELDVVLGGAGGPHAAGVVLDHAEAGGGFDEGGAGRFAAARRGGF